MKLSTIKKNPNNPRVIRDAKFELLKKSIRDFPQMMALRPIIVDETNTVLGGNMRLEALKALGMKEIPDHWVSRADELTEEQKKEFVVKDNAGFGEWDWDALANEWSDLPLADWGLDLPEFEVPEESGTADAQVDKAAELNERWQVKTGDLWVIGSHRLLCGDSTKADDVARLIGEQVVGMVIFDPPFDADVSVLEVRWQANDSLLFSDHRHLFDCVSGWGLQFRSCFVWDGVTSWYVKGQPLARAKFCLWFGDSEYDEDGAHYGEPDRPKTVRNSRGTYNYVPDDRGKHLSTVYQSPNTQQFDGHKHSKPIEWLKMLIANCTNGVVFDPFAGSGSAMVACENLKRVCLSMELEANNVAVILDRLETMGLKPERAR